MKKFKFSLQKVLEYKIHMLDSEKAALRGLFIRREEAVRRETALENAQRFYIAEYERRCREGLAAGQMAALHGGLAALRRQIEKHRLTLNALEDDINRQTEKVIGLSREKTAMEKLKNKQLVQYRALEGKEDMRFIEDFVQNKRFTDRMG